MTAREGANVVRSNLSESRLEGVEAFDDVAPEDLRTLELCARVVELPKGEPLFVEGDPRRDVYALVAGRIKVSRLSRRGKEFILELIEPGEVFGESSLFEDGPHDAFGVAFEDSRVISIPARELEAFMKTRLDLPLRLAKLVELRRKRMEMRLVALAFQNVRGRMASLLLQLCHDYGVRAGDGIRLGIELRHQEMANLIGVSREIVSHTLSDFRRKGLIDSEGRRLIVPQMLPLEELEDVTLNREETTS